MSIDLSKYQQHLESGCPHCNPSYSQFEFCFIVFIGIVVLFTIGLPKRKKW